MNRKNLVVVWDEQGAVPFALYDLHDRRVVRLSQTNFSLPGRGIRLRTEPRSHFHVIPAPSVRLS